MLVPLSTNEPELVQPTQVVPGISDHKAVLCELVLSHVKEHSTSRHIHNYEKVNITEINSELDNYYVLFMETVAETTGILDLWLSLKEKVFKLRDRFVPSRIFTPKSKTNRL